VETIEFPEKPIRNVKKCLIACKPLIKNTIMTETHRSTRDRKSWKWTWSVIADPQTLRANPRTVLGITAKVLRSSLDTYDART
jgi:hypothetical protein